MDAGRLSSVVVGRALWTVEGVETVAELLRWLGDTGCCIDVSVKREGRGGSGLAAQLIRAHCVNPSSRTSGCAQSSSLGRLIPVAKIWSLCGAGTCTIGAAAPTKSSSLSRRRVKELAFNPAMFIRGLCSLVLRDVAVELTILTVARSAGPEPDPWTVIAVVGLPPSASNGLDADGEVRIVVATPRVRLGETPDEAAPCVSFEDGRLVGRAMLRICIVWIVSNSSAQIHLQQMKGCTKAYCWGPPADNRAWPEIVAKSVRREAFCWKRLVPSVANSSA